MPYKEPLVHQVYLKTYRGKRKITHRRISMEITREEHDQWKLIAKKYDLSVPMAIVTLARAQEQLAPPPIRAETKHTLIASMRMIRKTGHLINQWCRVYHQKSKLSADDSRFHKSREQFLYKQLKEHESLIRRGLLLE